MGQILSLDIFLNDGRLEKKWSISTDFSDEGKKMWDDIYNEIKKNVSIDDLCGIGMGLPGPVLADGFVEVCVNLDLHNFNPVQIMQAYFPGVRIRAANDANVAALGEQWKGSGEGYTSLGLVTLGTGVGGAVIVDGDIVYGASGLSGEIGHIQLNSEETSYMLLWWKRMCRSDRIRNRNCKIYKGSSCQKSTGFCVARQGADYLQRYFRCWKRRRYNSGSMCPALYEVPCKGTGGCNLYY